MKHRITVFLRAGLLAALFLLLSPGGRAEGNVLARFLIRPEVTRQDSVLPDGNTRVGIIRGKPLTAQFSLSADARTVIDRQADIAALLEKGTLLRADWRVEAKDVSASSVSFLLWPFGSARDMQQGKIQEGWNVWDLTGLLEESLKRDESLSLRLQAAEGGWASFDLERSWIDVVLALPEDACFPESWRITESELLSAAFSALPLDHWALQRYLDIADTIVFSRWPETGVPYYFGGHSEEKVLRPFAPSQPSSYYRSDRYYLCGFDCSSFLRWAEAKAGFTAMDQLDQIIQDRASSFPVSRKSSAEWMQVMIPGDLLVIDHGTLHTGMIIGTPRMYGITAEEAPELADWLDAPLMIHCGEDPFVHDRFASYIETLTYRIKITPPDGGVTVSLLVNTPEDAPHVRTAPWGKNYGYFLLGDQALTVYPLSSCRKLAWLHPLRGAE